MRSYELFSDAGGGEWVPSISFQSSHWIDDKYSYLARTSHCSCRWFSRSGWLPTCRRVRYGDMYGKIFFLYARVRRCGPLNYFHPSIHALLFLIHSSALWTTGSRLFVRICSLKCAGTPLLGNVHIHISKVFYFRGFFLRRGGQAVFLLIED